jgi:hypothetical protein
MATILTTRVVVELLWVILALSGKLFAILFPRALHAQLQDNSIVIAQPALGLSRRSLFDPFHPPQTSWIGLERDQTQSLRQNFILYYRGVVVNVNVFDAKRWHLRK